ncbi:transposase [Bifidobacterium breve 689b]|nr:transposase [Bifidobacterium breve 689b]
MVEGLIQTIAERQGHGRRGRVGGRFPVAPGSRPGGPGAAQEGRVALLALGRKCPKYDDGGGERRWRHQDFGRYGVEPMAPRVACAEHGVAVAQVPWAEPGSRFTRDFEMERAWPTAVASRKTVGGFLRIAWRTAGDIARRVAARLGSSAVHVRRSHRDRRGRDQLQEGAHVHHRGRRPQAQTGRLGARRVRQGDPRPVLPAADRRAARLHQGGHRRRRQMDRRQREGAPAERRARARLVPHRLLDDRHARPGQETVVEPGPARQRQDSHGDDERPEIRRAPRTPAT